MTPNTALRFAATILLAGASHAALAAEVREIDHGVVVTPDSGPAGRVRLIAYGDAQIRVSAVPGDTLDTLPPSLMVTARPGGKTVITHNAEEVTLRLPDLVAHVRLSDGRVSFTDGAGKALLAETARMPFAPVTVDGQGWLAVTQRFNPDSDESFYGLGQHQNRQMDYNGEDVELAQHNMDIAIPLVLSTRGYGLLWDNDGISRFGNPHAYDLAGSDDLKVTSEGKPGWHADYYLGDRLAISRQETAIDYQFIKDQKAWPAEARPRTAAAAGTGQNTAGIALDKQRVVWTGSISSDHAGLHAFRLYASSYVRLYADGRPVLDRWRQNWNPWYLNFRLPMQPGKPVAIRVEWEPNQGYIALLHNNPQPEAERHALTMTSDVAKGIDYYVIGAGHDRKWADGVIANYRALTGRAAMMPEWAFGFWQSRQRYATQDELLGVVREYRRRHIPIDNVVEDWFYWPEDQWGSHDFDKTRFPDAKAMVDEVHALNAHVMISVWPKFYPGTANAREMDAHGWLYHGNLDMGNKDWVGPGYANTDYDAYAPGARDLFFAQLKPKLVDKGFDAWWLDASEPDIHSNLSIAERIRTMGPTAFGPGAALFNSYPLVHAEGLAQHMRQARPDVRPFILTRSGFGGLQRASAAVWSGDLATRWDDLHDQISAGVNLSLSGLPYWTHDIGGFSVEDRYSTANPKPDDLAEWHELNTRWFQFGAFSPLFRSHGEAPSREVYNLAAHDPAMYASMVDYSRLRYRLMPYIYTLGADAALRDGTIMRGLAMDFPADAIARRVDDEYLFGPDLLVAPVTAFGVRSRPVYLPAGSGWYDVASGAFHPGGQTITADAPLARMPLFARAGAIIPTGPAIEYTREQTDGPIVLQVYSGADGHFDLYEDDGSSQGYAKGQFARLPVTWDDAKGVLTIGARQGSYPGMAAKRAISVRFHGPDAPAPLNFDENGATQAVYTGAPLTITRP